MSYPHVDNTLAKATKEIVSAIMPAGFDTAHDDAAPGSLEACTDYFKSHGRMCVGEGFNARTSIFADAWTTHAFAAWHDFCHVQGQCAFDPAGERRVDEIMQQHLARWWTTSARPVTQDAFLRASAVLKMFNLGRLEYWLEYGEQPADPRQFLYGYLTAQARIAQPEPCSKQSDTVIPMVRAL
jgi:hypothetical protein